jgi:hypothetical protein
MRVSSDNPLSNTLATHITLLHNLVGIHNKESVILFPLMYRWPGREEGKYCNRETRQSYRIHFYTYT